MSIKKYSQEVIDALTRLKEIVELEDQYIRKLHIYEAKQNDLYWHGFQYIYWDNSREEFRIPTHEQLNTTGSTREEAEVVYDYVTNIFKAHGLSIIAALSADTPGVIFYPANSNNPDDICASKKANELAEVIHKINCSKLALIHALFILFTQHFVACELEYDRNEEYGTVNVPKFKNQMQQVTPDFYACMTCSYGSDLPVDTGCPNCEGNPQLETIPGQMQNVPTKIGTVPMHKGFPLFSMWGVINVRFPSYAVTQKDGGYLIKVTDQPIAWLRDKFPDLKGEQGNKISADDADSYEKLARSPSTTQYFSEAFTNNLLTYKQIWFRPWQYSSLEADEQINLLKKEFPTGVYCSFAGIKFCEAREENFDDCWEITKGDLSRTIHGDPLGKSLISNQDIRNTTSNLLLECLEQSIPINFADPNFLDFDKFSGQEIKPGPVYPIKQRPPGAGAIGEGFFSFKVATLPKEGVDLQKQIDEDGQMVSGDFPSVFGGSGEGSKTLGEYQESQVNALRRLAIVNYFIYCWWSRFTHKAVKMHIKNMIEDDEYTLQKDGRFVNISIMKEHFKGKFNVLIPESASELPLTFGQKRNMIMQAIQLNNDQINSFLFAPENLKVVLRYFGLNELVSPEDNQVQGAFRLIGQLLQSEQEINEPVDQDVTDITIHSQIFKNFLSSDTGQDQKEQNPIGYQNCLMYLKQLSAIMQQQLAAQQTGVQQ